MAFKWGSNIDSSIPFPQRAANKSMKGKIKVRELKTVRILELKMQSLVQNTVLVIEPGG